MTGIDLSGGRNGKAPVVKLSSGYGLPVVGLGTYALHGSTCVNAVRTALESGYRLIDTASFYGNEREVGEGVRASGVPREEVVVQTKLYPNQYGHAARAIEECLSKLDLGYHGFSNRTVSDHDSTVGDPRAGVYDPPFPGHV